MENRHIPGAYRDALESAGYTPAADGGWGPDFCALPVAAEVTTPAAEISSPTRPERPGADNVRYLDEARAVAPERPSDHRPWLGVETAAAQVLTGPWRHPKPESTEGASGATALLERPQTHAPAPQQPASKKAAPAGPTPIGEEGAVFQRFEQALTRRFDDATVGELFRVVVASFEGEIREGATAERLRAQFSEQVALEGCGRVVLDRARTIYQAVNPEDPRPQEAIRLALKASHGREEITKAHLPRRLKEQYLDQAAQVAAQSLAIFSHAYDRTRHIPYAPAHANAEQTPPVAETQLAASGLRRLLGKLSLRRRRR